MNRGKSIDSANRRFAYLGAPYCASFGSLILERAGAVRPSIRSGSSRRFVRDPRAIDAREVFYGRAEVPREAVAIFIRPGGGHFAFVIDLLRRGARAILRLFEFNTSPGVGGSQYDGRWSGYRDRDLRAITSPLSAFRITHFVPVEYAR